MMIARRAMMAALLLALAGPASAKDPKVGDVAPDFEITLLDKSKVKLSDLRGQVVVLNFWATWCGPCREELPLLDAYYRRQEQHGLRVFAVTTEDSLPLNRLKPLFAQLAITPGRGIKGPYNTLKAVPTNFIIDRKGVVRYARAAALRLEDLNDLLVPLLKEPA